MWPPTTAVAGSGTERLPRTKGSCTRTSSRSPNARLHAEDPRRVWNVLWRHRDDDPLQQLHAVVRPEHALVDEDEVLLGRPDRRCNRARGGGSSHGTKTTPRDPGLAMHGAGT